VESGSAVLTGLSAGDAAAARTRRVPCCQSRFSVVAVLGDMPVNMSMNWKIATALAVPAHAAAPKPYHNGLNPSLCLDADAHNGGVGPGANVTAWPCHGGPNQTWG
jgi:hypothetical protein